MAAVDPNNTDPSDTTTTTTSTITTETTTTTTSTISTSLLTTSSGETIPGWAIGILVMLGIILLVGIIGIVVCVKSLRRKREDTAFGRPPNEAEMLKEKYRRPGFVSPRKETSLSEQKSTSKSPITRVRAISAQMTAGRTPVLPHKRLAVEVRSPKKRNAGTIASVKGKLFSASGKPLSSQSAFEELDKLDEHLPSTMKSDMTKTGTTTSDMKTVQKFAIGKRKGKGAELTPSTSPSTSASSKSELTPKERKKETTASKKPVTPGTLDSHSGASSNSHEANEPVPKLSAGGKSAITTSTTGSPSTYSGLSSGKSLQGDGKKRISMSAIKKTP